MRSSRLITVTKVCGVKAVEQKMTYEDVTPNLCRDSGLGECGLLVTESEILKVKGEKAPRSGSRQAQRHNRPVLFIF
jgi:hypothetical protein